MSMAWTVVRALAMSAAFAVCGASQAQTPTQSAAAMAAPADEASRTLAHDIFQHVIGMETSVEGRKARVP